MAGSKHQPPPGGYFAESHLLRSQLVAYYREVSAWMVPHLRGRNVTVIRCPKSTPETQFFQKHPRPNEGPGRFIRVDSAHELLAWIERGTVEWHIPLGTSENPLQHDWAVFDLDPNPPAAWPDVVRIATILLGLLDGLGIPSCLKTSGNRGLHVYVAIVPTDHQQVVAAVRTICHLVEAACPEWATTTRRVADRGPRVYLDYLQNGHTRTMAGVFTVRANARARISTPISRDELSVPPETWSIDRVLSDLATRRELFLRPDRLTDLSRTLLEHKIPQI